MPRAAWVVLVALALVAGVAVVVLAPAHDARESHNMALWQAAVLGTVEGLTEFLPVSSTGHLLVVQRLLGVGAEADQRDAADAFAICVQLGAILAVLLLYRRRVLALLRGLVGVDTAGRRLLGRLLVAFLPAAIVGLLLGDWIKAHLFGPWPIVLAWALGGGAILWVARDRAVRAGGRALEALTVRGALWIGVLQCVAMWPGVSRSLVTIVGGLLVGLSTAAAVEFSFLLGMLTLAAASGHDGVAHGGDLLAAYSPVALLVGLTFAFVSALLAVHWMVGWLKAHGLAVFGWYRLGVAAVVTTLLLAGVLR
ncbi:MAG: undecaprenyl-diphosphate phosphatase [Planctomycetota bacterium]|nr:undecaprenyl-diphosphate phosphatase [Planctomycetota bacterium]